MKKKWKVFLIHHSHTDIGYTERQDKIKLYHVDFIKQAIDQLNAIHVKELTSFKGFVWQCENHWQVKTFYEMAEPEYIRDFEKYVKSGEIGLSGNYLNMTELIQYDILDSRHGQVEAFGKAIGYPITSGMTADVNGFAWGYGDTLYDHGITNLFSCVHPHHGMFPLYKKQMPFYWETPKGNKVLVWNGEHYHFGNELHFTPQGSSSYLIEDDIARATYKDQLYRKDAADTEEQELKHLQMRLTRYLENLEKEEYPADFVPFMVSGAITDNAPPNMAIAQRANILNERFEGQIEVKMVTLDQFFDYVQDHWKGIETYKGDWNDWWADGVGSTPNVMKVFRDAQRKHHLVSKLTTEEVTPDEALLEEARENLMLYAEHTWGYSSSVSEPWETMVADLELKKSAYAINGNTAISSCLDRMLALKGEVPIRANKPQQFRIVNPHNRSLTTTALLFVEFWEYIDGVVFDLNTAIEVIDCETGESLPVQVKRIPRAYQLEVLVTIKAHEERSVYLRRSNQELAATLPSHAHVGAEGVRDIILTERYQETPFCVETDAYRIQLDQAKGITSIVDKSDSRELVRQDSEDPLFGGVYEVTPIVQDACYTRKIMGRNRKAIATKRYRSVLSNIQVVENGPVFVAIQLDYTLQGTQFYTVFLKVYKGVGKISATVRIHKDSLWEPENLYIALPLTAGNEEVKYIDKTGCIIRPGIDQLPGTNQEFYLLQQGIVYEQDDKAIILGLKDTPLVTFGDLAPKGIRLCDGNNQELNQGITYAWPMNNYWETNFKVDLGGFYEFTFSMVTMDHTDKETAMEYCEILNEGLVTFYTND